MPITTTVIKRVIAVLKLSRRIGQFITEAEAIVAAVGSHATTFPTPQPPLATITTDINDLRAKENIAQTRVAGAVQARNAARSLVLKDLRWLTAYVQEIADDDPVNAQDIILSAGLKVKTVTARVKPDFTAKNDTVSGTIVLIAKAGPARASHEWQSSLNGASWTPQPATLQAKTKVNSFTPGQRAYFRHRIVTKEGPGNWSQTVNLIVL